MSANQLYYEGYGQALENVRNMNQEQLLAHLDMLYGRENLPDDFSQDDLRTEALDQTRRDFLTPYGKERLDDAMAMIDAFRSQFGPDSPI